MAAPVAMMWILVACLLAPLIAGNDRSDVYHATAYDTRDEWGTRDMPRNTRDEWDTRDMPRNTRDEWDTRDMPQNTRDEWDTRDMPQNTRDEWDNTQDMSRNSKDEWDMPGDTRDVWGTKDMPQNTRDEWGTRDNWPSQHEDVARMHQASQQNPASRKVIIALPTGVKELILKLADRINGKSVQEIVNENSQNGTKVTVLDLQEALRKSVPGGNSQAPSFVDDIQALANTIDAIVFDSTSVTWRDEMKYMRAHQSDEQVEVITLAAPPSIENFLQKMVGGPVAAGASRDAEDVYRTSDYNTRDKWGTRDMPRNARDEWGTREDMPRQHGDVTRMDVPRDYYRDEQTHQTQQQAAQQNAIPGRPCFRGPSGRGCPRAPGSVPSPKTQTKLLLVFVFTFPMELKASIVRLANRIRADSLQTYLGESSKEEEGVRVIKVEVSTALKIQLEFMTSGISSLVSFVDIAAAIQDETMHTRMRDQPGAKRVEQPRVEVVTPVIPLSIGNFLEKIENVALGSEP